MRGMHIRRMHIRTSEVSVEFNDHYYIFRTFVVNKIKIDLFYIFI